MKTVSAVRPFSAPERRPGSLRSKAGLCALALALGALPLVAAPSPAPGTWVPQGPGPTIFGQVEGIQDGQVVGAIHTVAPHPHAAGTIFVGAVNGGIWKTTNATSQNVKWDRLTDAQASNSIGALEFDPTDPAYNTLVAGIGRFSSFSATGGARTGLLKTTNDGKNWTAIDGGGILFNKNIAGVAPRGNTIVVAVNTATPNTIGNIGIWRTTNGGATFTQISNGNGTATGLPGGITNDLVGDPHKPNRLYTSVTFADLVGGRNGIFRSDDTGATWTRVSNPAIEALMVSGTTGNVEMAVGQDNNVYVALVNGGRLAAVFRSGDGGATWASMGVPVTNEGGPSGAHPGAQGNIHLSIVADPTNANIVYVGGDRQPLFREPVGGPFSFPNSIGAANFTGRLFRGDATKPAGSQWVHLTNSSTLGAAGGGTASNSSPHADSREMMFDARGDLIETDDGGIYRRTSPRDNTGDWFSLNGDLQTTEIHNVAYDTLSNITFGGTQDTGLPYQFQGVMWDTLLQGDGGDVGVDDFTIPGTSVRYSSNQNLGNFNRTFWDSANNFIGFAFPALTLVGGGANPVRHFYTPIAVNGVDGNRLAISANNSLYESLDRGDTIVEAGPGIRPNGTGIDPVAYGAGGNPNALYVGAADRVFIRLAAYPAPLVASATFPGNGTGLVVTDITLDPSDANSAFVTHQAGVFRTTNGGASWTTLTGNLPFLNPSTIRSIALVTGASGDALVVGTQNGAYYATEASGFATWSRLGTDLPVVPVYDLDYDAADDVLVAGTMGRGAWKLHAASSVTGGL